MLIHFQNLPKSLSPLSKYNLTSPRTGCPPFTKDETVLKLMARLHSLCKLTLAIYTAVETLEVEFSNLSGLRSTLLLNMRLHGPCKLKVSIYMGRVKF